MKSEYRLSVIEMAALVLGLGLILWSVPSCDKRPVNIESQYEPEQGPDPEPEPGGIRVNPMPIIVQTRGPSHTLTDDDLIRFATRYRVVSDGETLFTPEQKDRLREIDPDIGILRYLNFAAVYGDTAMQRVLEHHPDWILLGEDGYCPRAFMDGKPQIKGSHDRFNYFRLVLQHLFDEQNSFFTHDPIEMGHIANDIIKRGHFTGDYR